jgi:penicillin amidase
MIPEDPSPRDAAPPAAEPEPRTNFARRSTEPEPKSEAKPEAEPPAPRHHPRLKIAAVLLILIAILAATGLILTRRHIAAIMQANLPQLDGQLIVYGLSAPVTVQRDAHGVPHIHASSLDDLVFAQGYITAQDRLWQMDLLRRHASGQLAAILGRSMLDHDRLQRTLQLRAAADRAIIALPADQKRWLEIYANGVNASIAAQHNHLPAEFRLIGYQPAPWSARDSLLIELALFQDFTTGFPDKLGREALSAQLPPQLIADLYPTGSWRDHAPGQPIPDVTAPQTDLPDIPLDESQSSLHAPHPAAASTRVIPSAPQSRVILSEAKNPRISPLPLSLPVLSNPTTTAADLLSLNQTLALFHPPCSACVAGSNAWAVSGTRTASGKPLLSNDMHLALSVPDIWYEADLQADNAAPLAPFHAAGITLPGTPFVIAGHNQHVAWGFTNLRADIQDIYIEHTRGTPTGAEYQTSTGAWRPVRYQNEIIHVRGSSDVTLAVPLTQHGTLETPLISSLYPNERRSLSLAWTIYDPTTLSANFLAVDSATDWPSMLSAFANSAGLPLNLIYADDQGHIAYHAVGRIPIRGDANAPAPLSPVPTDATAPDAATHAWSGYIPFDQLPQSLDPADGVLATANSRVTLDGSRYPITLNWMAPYRTERIYKILEATPQQPSATTTCTAANPAPSTSAVILSEAKNPCISPLPLPVLPSLTTNTHPLTPADMLALQNDVFSELDQVIAQRLAYAIDHTTGPLKNEKSLHQAADILRKWNGSVDATAAAPAIVNAFRDAFWPMLLIPKLDPQFAPNLVQGSDLSKLKDLSPDAARAANLWHVYTWGERPAVEEQLLMHTPTRWLPTGFATWDDFLAAVVLRGLRDSHAPSDLTTWQQGRANPVDIEHPIFSRSIYLKQLIGLPVGTGPQPHNGDLTTVNNIGTNYGPSERFTADLADPDHTTLNIVTGQSANPASPFFLDQFQDWLRGTTYPLPFTPTATQPTITHTLTLTAR